MATESTRGLRRVLQRGLLSPRVWPILAGALAVAGLAVWAWMNRDLGVSGILLAALAACMALAGILRHRAPFVTLEADRFTIHGEVRPGATSDTHALHGFPGGPTSSPVLSWSSRDRSPRDLPWGAPVGRDQITGAAVRNGKLVVTLRDRKGRTIPMRGLSAEDRDALLTWFSVPSAKRDAAG